MCVFFNRAHNPFPLILQSTEIHQSISKFLVSELPTNSNQIDLARNETEKGERVGASSGNPPHDDPETDHQP